MSTDIDTELLEIRGPNQSRWDADMKVDIKDHGKYIFASMSLGNIEITHRIPLHVRQYDDDKQIAYYADVIRLMHKKLWHRRQALFGA